VSAVIIASVASSLLTSEFSRQASVLNSNPKIYVFDTYNPGSWQGWTTNITYPDNATLTVDVNNNQTISLFNVGVEVSYLTTANKWNTTTQTGLGFLDVYSSWRQSGAQYTGQNYQKYVTIYLTNPIFYEYYFTHKNSIGQNVTANEYILNMTDCHISAYGYAKP
jgi:hypothetical protein